MTKKIEITKYISQKIRIISLLAIFMVIVQHSSYGLDADGVNGIFRSILPFGIASFPVSYFFIVSGYFFARKFMPKRTWYFNELKKRFWSLAIPYLIYCIVGYIWWGYQASLPVLDSLGITSLLPVVGPLWYVRTLVVLCLISPILIVISKCADKNKWLMCILIVCFIVACIYKFPARKALGMSTIYFTFGTFLAVHGECFNKISVNTKFFVSTVILILLLVAKVAFFPLSATIQDIPIGWFIVPFTIATIWYGYDLLFKFKEIKITKVLSFAINTTFFVYCSEPFIRKSFSVILGSERMANLTSSIIGITVLSLAILCSGLCVAKILKRVIPIGYNVLAGGR